MTYIYFEVKWGSYIFIIPNNGVHTSNSLQDTRQNHWTIKYRSQWPTFILRSNLGSYWFIMPMYDVHASNSLQDIRQNHWTMKYRSQWLTWGMDLGVKHHGMKADPPGYLWSKYECFLMSGSWDIPHLRNLHEKPCCKFHVCDRRTNEWMNIRTDERKGEKRQKCWGYNHFLCVMGVWGVVDFHWFCSYHRKSKSNDPLNVIIQ